MKKCYFTCFVLLLHLSLFAQWRLNQIAGEAGLSHNSVTSIIQDKDGYLWFGTFNGINRYDGYSMKQYNYVLSGKGLSSNVIYDLFEDKDGIVWAGTAAGLNRINTNTGKIDVYFTGKGDPRYTGKVSIHQTQSGVFFINTLKGIRFFEIESSGKLKYDFFLKEYQGLNLNIQNLIPSLNGKFWFLTPTEKVKLHQVDVIREGKTPKLAIEAINYTETLFKEGSTIFDMLEYPKNTVWIVNNHYELLKIKLDENLKVLESEKIDFGARPDIDRSKVQRNINLCIDGKGKIWIAGNKLLLNYELESGVINNLSRNKQQKEVISNLDIREIYVDASHILWLCTLDSGLYKMDLDSHAFYNSSEYLNPKESSSLSKSPIVSMCEDRNGDFWMGTREGNILAMDKNMLKDTIDNSLKSPLMYTYSGKDKQLNQLLIEPEVKRLMSSRDGTIWAGALNGLFKITFDKAAKSYEVNEINKIKDNLGRPIESRVFAIEEDRKGTIWYGVWEKGLMKMTYNKKSKSYESINYLASSRDSTSLSNNNITDIIEGQNGAIWVATTNGLNKLNHPELGNSEFEKFYSSTTNPNSLSGNHILDLHEAKNGDIYVGTYGGGLNRVHYTASGELEFTQYTIKNGLPNDVVSQIKEDFDGNIWTMHIREISKLNPKTGDIIYFERKDGFNVEQFMGNAMEFTSTGTMICGGVGGFTFFQPNNITVNTKKP